jgi:hypothetical protein
MATCSVDPYVAIGHKSVSESGGAPKFVLSEAVKRRKAPIT